MALLLCCTCEAISRCISYIPSDENLQNHLIDCLLMQLLFTIHSQIWCNTWEQNHDPDYWEDPWTFKPERFLDEQGHLVGPDHPNRRRYIHLNW